MLVVTWERAWLAMMRMQAEEFIRWYNIAVLANPGANADERDRMLAEQQMAAAPRRGPGSLRKFGRWITHAAQELFGSA